MLNWVEQLQKQLKESCLVTLVTVINVQGSAPREVGARMLVTSTKQWGTIGGGNLEYSAVAAARDRQLANKLQPLQQKFALGPALGQCCGGSVELLFESITRETVLPGAAAGEVWCRRIDADGFNYDGAVPGQVPEPDATAPICVFEAADQTWLIEKLAPKLPTVVVFGAGHVGSALVKQLTLLPCSIVWIDQRSDWLAQANVYDQVTSVQTDWPEQEVPELPDDSWVIVLTHSHSTDFNICLALLKKQQFAFLGLIGSETKRNTFRKRFVQRGISEALIDRLSCPIGLSEISSRRPELIALAVAAQLAQRWQAVDAK